MTTRTALVSAEVFAILLGLAAAYAWWLSAQVKFEPVGEMPKKAGDGATVVQLDNGQLLHFDAPRQAKLNAQAAVLTATSTAFQAITMCIQTFS